MNKHNDTMAECTNGERVVVNDGDFNSSSRSSSSHYPVEENDISSTQEKEEEEEEEEWQDVAWREYNIHGNEDDNQAAFDLFQTPNDDDDDDDKGQQQQEQATYKVKDCRFNNTSENDRMQTLQLDYSEEYTQSTGISIWKGAETMLEYLQTKHAQQLVQPYKNATQQREWQVLELGAGMGLVSLAALYCLGATRVLATDGDVQVLHHLRRNVKRNRPTTTDQNHTIFCPQLIWGHEPHIRYILQTYGPSDVILSTETSYMTTSLVPLFTTARQCLSDKGVFIWIHEAYSQAGDVQALLRVGELQGFSWTSCAPTAPAVYLFRKTI